ncbi:hypothetical protein JGU71_28320 [Antrihabitans sp. YC3-6]|uniref:Uncharacterized protein n=1 Tax=Antrihabitans stalagmiti TaxID=2799499 RepID=A0A934NX28_9NOCA|nr:hypothetical protein [Antrihabitans stalagmiti]MBJ8342802.1 hypothetical protein [Antrihabitans stalagmiti]
MRIDKSIRDIDSDFETWWAHYPLKKAKGQAERAFTTARRNVDLDTLTAAVQAYSKTVNGLDPKFIAYGSTWLNGKRWLDEDIAPATATGIEDWLRDCWTNHNTIAITDRCGLEFYNPDIPEDVADVKAFTLQARRDWIKTNHDEIVARILKREAP